MIRVNVTCSCLTPPSFQRGAARPRASDLSVCVGAQEILASEGRGLRQNWDFTLLGGEVMAKLQIFDQKMSTPGGAPQNPVGRVTAN